MIERGEQPRFTLEALESIGIARKRLRKYLQGDVALELGVARAINLPHAPSAKGPEDLIGTEASTDHEAHGARGL